MLITITIPPFLEFVVSTAEVTFSGRVKADPRGELQHARVAVGDVVHAGLG